jgi:hypothetical protein
VANIAIASNRSNLHKSAKNTSTRESKRRETGEFIGIINYSLMALIQLELGVAHQPDLDVEKATELYDKSQTDQLMEDKNHDYGEVWREMRISS